MKWKLRGGSRRGSGKTVWKKKWAGYKKKGYKDNK